MNERYADDCAETFNQAVAAWNFLENRDKGVK